MIVTTNTHITFNGNDVAKQFNTNFEADVVGNIYVTLTDAKGVDTKLHYKQDYNLQDIGNSQGFIVEYPIIPFQLPLKTGEKLTVERIVPVIQNTDFNLLAKYSPKPLETTLDNIVKMIQQLSTVKVIGYSEGTWIPNMGGTLTTYLKQEGHWTKVGRLVNLNITLEILVMGSDVVAPTYIEGNPFMPLTNPDYSSAGNLNYTAGCQNITYSAGLQISTGRKRLATTVAQGGQVISQEILKSGARISGSITFMTDA